MRITGQMAAKEYARRFGRSTWVDRDIIDGLKDRVLEFDLDTEKLYATAARVSLPSH